MPSPLEIYQHQVIGGMIVAIVLVLLAKWWSDLFGQRPEVVVIPAATILPYPATRVNVTESPISMPINSLPAPLASTVENVPVPQS